MKPRLFPSDAVSFKNMGYGEIDAISCVVTEALNGEYDLHMTMLNTNRIFQNIKVGNIIAAKPNNTDPIQAFCIEEISKAINGEVEIYATHIAQFRSKLIPVANYTATSLSDAIDKAFTNSLESNPFMFTTDKTVATSYTLDAPRSFRELMGGKEGSLLDQYGGEYYFDNFSIQLLLHRGRDNGVYIFYGKNMTDFKADDMFGWDDSATGVVPFWYSEEDGLVLGDVQYSQYVNYYPYKRTIVKDFTEDFETMPTKAQLDAMALSWITNKGLNMANISVAFDDLVTDNKGKLISLGDTVHVINSMYDVDYTSRIVKTVFNVLLERYDSVEVGQLKQTINEAISDTFSDVNVSGEGGMIMDLLWTNASPTANFAAQTLSIDFSGYKIVIIETEERASSTRSISFVVPIESPQNAFFLTGRRENASLDLVSRSGVLTSSEISFTAGHNYAVASNTYTENNSRMVPVKIYGLK